MPRKTNMFVSPSASYGTAPSGTPKPVVSLDDAIEYLRS